MAKIILTRSKGARSCRFTHGEQCRRGKVTYEQHVNTVYKPKTI